MPTRPAASVSSASATNPTALATGTTTWSQIPSQSMSFSPDFLRAFSDVIGSEGGYVNDPKDPGGETKYGISRRAYPNLDIKNLTLEDAQGIYYRDFWAKLGLDSHPWSLSYPVFDTAVNLGVERTEAMLRTALKTPNPTRSLLSARLRWYRGLPTFPRFGDGWMDRVVGVALDSAKSTEGAALESH